MVGRGFLIAAVALAVVGSSLAMMPAGAGPNGTTFVAVLSGANEVPAKDVNGRGVAIVRVSGDGTSLSWKLIVANTDNIVASHIHCGAAPVNGPVVVGLYGGPATSDNGILSEGTATSVTARPDSASCPGGIATMADLIAKMESGGAYVNVHTTANPGGEIRGQLMMAG